MENSRFKFRAWVKNRGMYDICGFRNGGFGITIYPLDSKGIEMDAWYHKSGEISIMQYTGLKDKNGVEIYEGDIVKYYKHLPCLEPQLRTHIVQWDSKWDDFSCELHSGFDFPIDAEDLEVVGNIYEQNELLH